MRKSTRRIRSSKRAQSRKKMKGGALKDDALKYLKNKKIDTENLIMELLRTNGREKTMDNFTFKGSGLSHSFDLLVKEKNTNNSKYIVIESFHH